MDHKRTLTSSAIGLWSILRKYHKQSNPTTNNNRPAHIKDLDEGACIRRAWIWGFALVATITCSIFAASVTQLIVERMNCDWRGLRMKYYFESDKVAELVLEAILTATILPTTIRPDNEIKVPPTPTAGTSVQQSVKDICLVLFEEQPEQPMVAPTGGLPSERFIARNIASACETVKNEARRRRHQHLNQQLRLQLRTAIETATQQNVSRAGGVCAW